MNDQNDDSLRAVLQTHKILVDTCFLLHNGFETFLVGHQDIFSTNRILVPQTVLRELNTLRSRKPELAARIDRVLEVLKQHESLIDVRGEPGDADCTADQVLSRVVEQHIGRVNLLVLTNDRTLAEWIYQKKRAPCFRTRTSLLIAHFPHGARSPKIWRPSSLRNAGSEPQALRSKTSLQDLPPSRSRGGWAVKPFAVATQLAPDLEKPLSPAISLSQGAVVRTASGTKVLLSHELASGGEGVVFRTDQPGLVCKIYHPEKLTVGKKNKIELMTTRQIPDPTICWPKEAVYDVQGMFRGFLMPEARGEPLARGLFIPKLWLQKHPDWTRRESVALALTILEKINNLHEINVLLGDINPFNILVVDEDTVYFVDCDSYQVEGYPCPVGSINFVAPELQGKDFRQCLRTLEHELFAIATLLFMIMIPGKSPYSHQGGTDGAENIRKMHFPYPFKTRRAKNIAMGPWRFCWSHLSPKLKEAFYHSFHRDYRDFPRVKVEEWIALFKQYKRILENPFKVFRGPHPQVGCFDLDILPQNYFYIEKDGEILPKPLPPEGKTDLMLQQEAMVGAAQGSASNSYRQRPVVYARSQAPKRKRAQRPSTSVSQQPKSGWGWAIGGAIGGALVGSAFGPVGMLVGALVGGAVGHSLDDNS